MKKCTFVFTLLLCALLLTACGANNAGPAPTSAPTAEPAPKSTAAPAPVSSPAATEKPVSPEMETMLKKNEQVWKEMHDKDWMEGRLVIPSAGIDVALFSWGKEPVGDYSTDKITEIVRQDVVDREDSALIYYDDPVGNIIADHSNQSFSALSNVKVGDTGYILSGDRLITLSCSFAADGVNTGYGITDKDGGWNHPGTDYVLYTCLEDWTHIRLVGFSVKEEEFLKMNWIDVGSNSNAGVVSTVSAPAEYVAGGTATPVPSQTPAPTPTPTPTPTPAPTAAPEQTARQPAPQEPVYVEQYGYDIYADNSADFGYNVYVPANSSGDGYLS
jgi:hypothetical protein